MKALMMDEKDNIAVVLHQLQISDKVDVVLGSDERDCLEAKTQIPFGHKIAIKKIRSGDKVKKYGEVIGHATKTILKGEHVHIHNVASIRGSAKRE
jgi:altronate dehydratase